MSNKSKTGKAENASAQGCVPKLRFPEFRDAGAWEEKKLGEFVEILSGESPSKFEFVKSGIPYYKVEQLNDSDKYLITSTYNIKKTNKIAKKGSLIFPKRGASILLNKIRILSNDSYMDTNLMSLLPNNNIDNEFLYYFILHVDLSKIADTTSIPQINNKHINPYKIYIPAPPEQQKIADCLSSLDEIIAAQAQKLDTLRAHKKGLMQQLFPAEGETFPKLRFPEFRDAGEWKIRELGDFITERNQSPKEKLPLFSLTIEDGVTPKTERYERSFLVNNEDDAYKLVLPDDFAYNPMNLRFGAIGRHSGVEKVALSKYYNIFYCDKTVNSRFCEIYFKSCGMITHYDNVATGSLIEKRRVHFSKFLKFNIRFPLLPEQDKIADCLSSLDELIDTQGKKVDALKVHKKGLMQQLFPSIDEVDG
ncbi:MAG: restriction endonuclease subunit S [Halobacteriota archaeon]|nr:restriction endonuclease subunit S [Halobacteriota archaeon]